VPEVFCIHDGTDSFKSSPPGPLTAEAELEADEIQNLSDILNAAVGPGIRFRVRIELGGETPAAR